MDVGFSCYTAKGGRSNNEDTVSLLEDRNGVLALIADGLGGLADGEVASRQAVSAVNRLLRGKTPDAALLIEAIQQAGREIFAEQNPNAPMYTTAAALWLGEGIALAAHVGDTRIYQFRGGEILYQSLDHSMAQVAVMMGELRQDEIRGSAARNRLVRVLGSEACPKVDCAVLSPQPGDRFLLCSDGFWETVTEEMMLQTMGASKNAREWLDMMRRRVLEAGLPGQDNHTAIAVIIKEAG